MRTVEVERRRWVVVGKIKAVELRKRVKRKTELVASSRSGFIS
jgi:hypothetical protein